MNGMRGKSIRRNSAYFARYVRRVEDGVNVMEYVFRRRFLAIGRRQCSHQPPGFRFGLRFGCFVMGQIIVALAEGGRVEVEGEVVIDVVSSGQSILVLSSH